MLFIKEINLSNFDTTNVTDMNSMFCGCNSLKKINISMKEYKEYSEMY